MNQKPEIRNRKSETRNQKLEARSWRETTSDQRPATSDPLTGDQPRWLLLCCFLFLALCSLLSSAVRAQGDNVTRQLRGKYLYRTLAEQRERGREEWMLTVHPDGSRTLRTTVRITDTGVLRDVIHIVDKDFRPKETYMVLWVKGQLRGSALYSVSGTRLEIIVNSPTSGRTTREETVPEKFSLIPHPVATDGWHFWYYDEARGGAQEGVAYNPETLGAGLGKLQSLKMRLMGKEEVTTPAGTFQTRHFELADVFHVWVSDKESLMVRMTLPSANLEYLLSEYQEEK